MLIKKLWLQDFRGYGQKLFDFEKPIAVLVGQNGVGKTTVIEAVHAISSASSFRAGTVDEMVRFGKELGRVAVQAVENDQIEAESEKEDILKLELTLTKGVVQGKRTHKQHYAVNGVKKRKKDFVGRVIAVTFRPEDMRLVEGSPGRRRSFLDEVLSLAEPQYAYASKQYANILRRRNKLLEAVRERRAPRTALQYWNENLVKYGEYMQQQRQQFADFCNEQSFPEPFSFSYQPKLLNEARMNKYLDRAIAAGHTLIGPHKDEFEVLLDVTRLQQHLSEQITPQPTTTDDPNEVSVAAYGSRGQQRLVVLWLRFCQIYFLEQQHQTKAVVLLDDILSELDAQARDLVWSLLGDRQMIITTAQPELLATAQLEPAMIQTFELGKDVSL